MTTSHPGTTRLRRPLARLVVQPLKRPVRRRSGLAGLAMLGLVAACGGTDPAPPARVASDSPAGTPGLRMVDSIGLAENDSVFVGLPTDIALRGDDEICVADGFQARVSCFDRKGGWTRSFGQKGRGPGELLKPSHDHRRPR